MTDSALSIAYLADYPEHVPLVAAWLHDQFGHLSTAKTLVEREERLRASLHRGQIPTTWVALQGETPLGTASLVASDMSARPDLSPWLASVYVHPSVRNQGVGRALVRRVVAGASALGYTRCWLYTTDDRLRFYGHMGWHPVEQLDYLGGLMTVMAIDLTPVAS